MGKGNKEAFDVDLIVHREMPQLMFLLLNLLPSSLSSKVIKFDTIHQSYTNLYLFIFVNLIELGIIII